MYLVNGKKVTLTVQTTDRADQVLEQVGAEIELNSDLTYYFGLFIERESDNACECVCVCVCVCDSVCCAFSGECSDGLSEPTNHPPHCQQ